MASVRRQHASFHLAPLHHVNAQHSTPHDGATQLLQQKCNLSISGLYPSNRRLIIVTAQQRVRVELKRPQYCSVAAFTTAQRGPQCFGAGNGHALLLPTKSADWSYHQPSCNLSFLLVLRTDTFQTLESGAPPACGKTATCNGSI